MREGGVFTTPVVEMGIRRTRCKHNLLSIQIENALSSEDFGKDLASAQSLLKKHQLVEVDIVSYEDRIVSLKMQCQHFQEIQHFDADKIKSSTEVVVVRFEKYVSAFLFVR